MKCRPPTGRGCISSRRGRSSIFFTSPRLRGEGVEASSRLQRQPNGNFKGRSKLRMQNRSAADQRCQETRDAGRKMRAIWTFDLQGIVAGGVAAREKKQSCDRKENLAHGMSVADVTRLARTKWQQAVKRPGTNRRYPGAARLRLAFRACQPIRRLWMMHPSSAKLPLAPRR
jgi:hypothetical protein